MSARMSSEGRRQKLSARRLIQVYTVIAGLAWSVARARAVALTGLYLFLGLQGALGAFLLKPVVDALFAHDSDAATTAAFAYLAILAAGTIANDVLQLLQVDLADRITHELDRRLIQVTAGAPGLDHLENPAYADRLKQIRERQWIPSQMLQALNGATFLVVGLAASIVLLSSIRPWLGFLPAMMVPSLWIQSRAFRRRWRAYDKTPVDERLAEHYLRLATEPAGAKEIRLFGLRAHILAEFETVSKRWIAAQTRARLRQEMGALVGQVLYAAALAATIGALGVLALDGRVTPGEVALGVQVARLALGHIQQSANVVATLSEAGFTGEKYLWLLEYQPQVVARSTADARPAPTSAPAIVLDNVSFRYPGTEALVLRDVSLAIPRGATVALVGENGAGKSSLVKLLARFYDPSDGAITIDGIDLREIDLDAWRGTISSSFQDFVKFELVAAESVGVGDLSAIEDRARIEEATAFAGAGRIIGRLPEGLDTQLGRRFEGGQDLSEGEWQRVALARGAMRNAPGLIILDEPTASLDARAEHEVFASFAALAGGAGVPGRPTTVLVSHRFSTVRMADLIVVLHHGAVEEIGSHEDLIARGGRYAELFAMQASRYDDPSA